MSKPIIQLNEESVKSELKELVRNSVEETLNELLNKEAEELTSAAKYERTEARQGYRSGHYSRKLTTTSGEVRLEIPKLKGVPFETAIIERYRRRESSVEEALIEMYLAGVSVRRVEDISEALWGSRVSASTISDLNQKAYVHIEEWRNRKLSVKYPYVYVDGIYLKRNWGGEFENVSILVAIGVDEDGYREIIGAAEGMKFYLLPSIDTIRKNGFGSLITDAMNQAFFTLSLGIAAMEIFGSYMSDKHTLTGEAARICALDTFVALMAGTIIFPACFSFGVSPEQGPSLIFVTLPQVFVNMAGGRFWGALFFLFMIFASFSTVLAVFENIIAVCMDTFGLSRKKAVAINFILLALLSLPCVFGYNIWSDLHLIGGRDVLDTEDFLVSNLLLPIGSLVYLLFCVSKWGWGFDKYIAEVNKGTGIRLSPKLKQYFQWILPILILIILVQGLI